jgi:hypothetical protein
MVYRSCPLLADGTTCISQASYGVPVVAAPLRQRPQSPRVSNGWTPKQPARQQVTKCRALLGLPDPWVVCFPFLICPLRDKVLTAGMSVHVHAN